MVRREVWEDGVCVIVTVWLLPPGKNNKVGKRGIQKLTLCLFLLFYLELILKICFIYGTTKAVYWENVEE